MAAAHAGAGRRGVPPAALLLALLSTASWWCAGAEAARILAVFGMKGRSHNMVNEPLVRALAARGHAVDVYGHFVPDDAPVANVTYFKLERAGALGPGLDIRLFESRWRTLLNPVLLLAKGQGDCEAVFADPAVRRLIRSDNKYDLFITELFNTDCYLGFGHRFQAPVVALSTSPILPWGNGRFGNPDNPAYIPSMHSGSTDTMGLWERVVNAAILLTSKLAHRLHFEARDQAVLDEAFGPGVPPVRELAANTSLLFVNTFHALSLPRPFTTNVIEIGGVHITKPDPSPLPQV